MSHKLKIPKIGKFFLQRLQNITYLLDNFFLSQNLVISRKYFQERKIGEEKDRKRLLGNEPNGAEMFSCEDVWVYTQINLFEIWINQIEIILYIPFSDWFGSKRTFVWFYINRKMVDTIWLRLDLISYREDFSVCTVQWPQGNKFYVYFQLKEIWPYWQFYFSYDLNRITFGWQAK